MTTSSERRIAAIVLAAGRSQRMGEPKMLLPWGDTTVIGQVVRTLAHAGLKEIVVVTGAERQQVEFALRDYPARPVYNPRYLEDQMALSLQVGLASLPDEIDAALIALGDQPQMKLEVVQQVLQAYRESQAFLVFPSYQMRRGHPWMIARSLWGALLETISPQTMAPQTSSAEATSSNTLREILQPYTDQTRFVTVGDDSILRDLDTPADYQKDRPDRQAAPDPEKL